MYYDVKNVFGNAKHLTFALKVENQKIAVKVLFLSMFREYGPRA